ncbi:hypothetical protein TTHERM_00047100 (macronuclear) [Tetrahymena thermophila SB210]|uniref:YTH domain-containing protein n=1 Tax=Tetrahymena thermophila (strain SB210) TaxID=312017 RepID=Q23DI1_TETTS|nr:hypothetical protein TTHERM_00047100 [Tetrahymena thermophila SB210]EAR94570.3 hypothetical protein TTHERM_00047100 [Tetrahymena thermophila SB210]|eukprot:XP_001014705.3 hypothetical protein TTHERM_00047100 [Tetrahymena thermophila SB210]
MNRKPGQGSHHNQNTYNKKPQKNQQILSQSFFSFNNNDPAAIEKKCLNSNLKQPSDGIKSFNSSQLQKLDVFSILLDIPHIATPADSLECPLSEEQFKKHTNDPAYEPEKYPVQKLYDLKYKIGIIQQIPQAARFFQMKAYQWEAIKAGVLYGTWSTSIDQNILLDQAFCEAKGKYPIILFFSINQSKSFQGVAVMKSRVNPQWRQDVWDDNKKFQGLFFIEWIYVQHILSTEFKGILNSLNYNKPVINQRNGQQINYEAGIQMLEVFMKQSQSKRIDQDYIWNTLIQFDEPEDHPFLQHKEKEVVKPHELLMQCANLMNMQQHSQEILQNQLPQLSQSSSNPQIPQNIQYLPHQQTVSFPQHVQIPQSNQSQNQIQPPQQLQTSQQIQYHNQHLNNMNFMPFQSMPYNQYAYQLPFPFYPYTNNSIYQPNQYFQPLNLLNPLPNNSIPTQQFPQGQQYNFQDLNQQSQTTPQQQNQNNQKKF